MPYRTLDCYRRSTVVRPCQNDSRVFVRVCVLVLVTVTVTRQVPRVHSQC